MIRCEQVSLYLQGKPIIHDVSFRAGSEKITAIIGPNGAGKSTLFNALLGLIPLYKGKISINSVPLENWRNKDLARYRAYMAQSKSTLLSLPVYEYLALSRLHTGESQELTEEAVEQVIYQLNLLQLARRPIDKLSGGEWQRVDLARAWCQLIYNGSVKGTLLLLDEPASALDIYQTQMLYQNLNDFTKNGGTVLIIEHDLNVAARYCDALVMIKSGQMIASGAMEDTFTTERVNTCFNVNGTMTISPATQSKTFVL